MKCVICQYGETEPGTRTVALTRDETTIVIRDVPAQICTICGEEYVDATTGKRLSQIAETAVNEGVQVDVRRYKAAPAPPAICTLSSYTVPRFTCPAVEPSGFRKSITYGAGAVGIRKVS